jgi:hypothetical protein
MRKTSSKEVVAVLALEGPARFHHFVKRVVDEERAWGLWSDGWALMADSDGRSIFPFWPSQEYAALCAIEQWSGFAAEEIRLEDLLTQLLPELQAEGVHPGVFPTPGGRGVVLGIEELEGALREEMKKY